MYFDRFDFSKSRLKEMQLTTNRSGSPPVGIFETGIEGAIGRAAIHHSKIK
jgi:hypothetical protein